MSKSISDKVVRNTDGNTPFSTILEANMSRRLVMRGSLGSALALFAGASISACGGGSDGDDDKAVKLGFASLPNSMTDACVVPAGYVASVIGAWGTPLNDQAAPWSNEGRNTSQDLLHSTGMHHDGMHYFPLAGSSSEGLLVVNHEYIDEKALHPNGPTSVDGKRPAEEVRKEVNAHGVAVMHVRKEGSKWEIIQNSRYNRRFTSATPMNLSGPVAGTDWVKTPFSTTGSQVRGTNNNCGNGTTPWGTYITAEENWAACFVNTGEQTAAQKRVGVQAKLGRYQWETAAGDASEQQGEFARFNITATGADGLQDWRNEVNGFGYLVEIDPYDPSSTATKRTAMGRFAHEGAAYGIPVAGKPLAFYSGDDSRFEYIYRFVSEALWDPKDAARSDRIAVGNKYLDKGTLYVARFDAEGKGEWLALTPATKGKDGRSLGEAFGNIDAILINTRGAADFVGATPMDRPEWTAVHPSNGDVYLTLTNNTSRNAERGTNAANPRLNNVNGHIVRWHDDAGANTFRWDIFVFGSDAASNADTNRSGLTELNQLASPDGIAFDDRGILWIQTDNGIDGGRNNAVAKATNDQMLAVVPGALKDAKGTGPVINAGNQAELRRFFVGPNEAEITGFAYTPDHTSIFLNIQHPVNWPAYGTADATRTPDSKVRPRSSTVVIQKADGGPIGV
ncbi:PhoX family phosphatase [Comamonas piscis]|uniref:PhoX family phosphatase n=1 Tax=Comamonas piscis TaxID=1562974 RepID=A0A7G5EMK0_9BURK|nr:PhoX family phosphatase [Comamonas piscis]QMV75225.1 PhoX family phosphatase [Comamonas piscis]WSO33716.1 PhoX family phosphatase [Comamonas piscis]